MIHWDKFQSTKFEAFETNDICQTFFEYKCFGVLTIFVLPDILYIIY